MKKLKSLLDKLSFRSQETQESREDAGREYLAEQLEARVLYSGTAPDVSLDDQPVQEASADYEAEAVGADGSPVSAIEAAQQASAEMEQFVSEGIQIAGGETDISEEQDVVILNPEVFGDLGPNGGLGALSQEAAQGALDAAAERWSASGVLTDDQGAALGDISVQVADLEGDLLLVVSEDNSTILLDIDAAGREWFVDGTPLDDSEFTDRVSLNGFRAESGNATQGVDVLTILMEAQGSLLGVDGVSAGREVSATGLEEGLRRIPFADDALTNPDEVTTSLVIDLAQSAAQRWEDSGLNAAQLEALANIEYRVVDLSSGIIGAAEDGVISIDIDAAAKGWFVDLSPEEDSEFGVQNSATSLSATDDAAAEGVDLLSVIMHEQGHVLGLDHVEDSSSVAIMTDLFSEGDRRLIEEGDADGANPGSLEGAHFANVDGTWTGAGDGSSWNSASNWSGSAPSTHGTLTIDTAGTIDSVYRDGGTGTYSGGSTFQGNVNLDRGIILIDHTFETGSNGVFNIGNGSGTDDAIVNVTNGGRWTFDRHNNGTFTVNIQSDGQLNATGTGVFETYGGHNGRKWEINVQGGSLSSEAAWNMSDGAGSDASTINISNGGSVEVGAITVHEEVIDFSDNDPTNSFSAEYGGGFANITAVNAAIGTTFTSSGGGTMSVVDNGSSFSIGLNAPPVISDLDDITYSSGDGTVTLDQGVAVSVTDDGANFDSGVLTVSFSSGGDATEDDLSIRDQGAGAGQIGFNGTAVTFEGTEIGTAAGGAAATDLVITLNSDATSTAVSALLQNITYENSVESNASSRLVEVSLTDGSGAATAENFVIAMNFGGAVDTFIWDGVGAGADGESFGQGGNYEGDPASGPDSNDIVIFRSNDPGTINLGGGTFTVGEVKFDGTGSFTIENGTLQLETITQTASATGTNVISAAINAIAFNSTVSGGSLRVENASNSIAGGIWDVSAGATLDVGTDGTNSALGNANVELDNSTLSVFANGLPTPDPSTITGLEAWYDASTLAATLNDGDQVTAWADRSGNGRDLVTGEGTATFEDNEIGGNPAVRFNNDNEYLEMDTVDEYFAKDTYLVFRAGNGDRTLFGPDWGAPIGVKDGDNADRTWMLRGNEDRFWNDELPSSVRRNGVDVASSNQFDMAAVAGNSAMGEYMVLRVVAGPNNGTQVREYIVGNRTDAWADARFDTAEVLAFNTELSTTDRDTVELYLSNKYGIGSLAVEANLPNSVTVTGTSNIEVESGFTANFDSLTVAPGATVNIEGKANFSATVLGGNTTIHLVNNAEVNLGAISETVAANLTFSGSGTVTMESASSHSGSTTVKSGVQINASNGDAFGADTSGTTVESGATINFASGNYNENFTISGTGFGSGDSEPEGALKKSAGSDVDLNGLITLSGDARIYSSGENLLIDGGINVNGNTLTLDAQSRIQIRSTSLSGAGLVRVEGNDLVDIRVANTNYGGDFELFNDGQIDLHTSNALGDHSGTTTLLGSNTNIGLRGSHTQRSNFVIEGGKNNWGAFINWNGDSIIDGNVEMTADARIWNNDGNSSVTITGNVIGYYTLEKVGSGKLILGGTANDFNLLDWAQGDLQVNNTTGLGNNTDVVIEAGRTLEFNPDSNITAITASQSLTLFGGTLSVLANQVTIDADIKVGLFNDMNFAGDGDLVLTQAIGNGLGVSSLDVTANLQAWYDASTLSLNDGDTVTAWADQSGNGRNLITYTGDPTFETNEIGGMPAIRFDSDENLHIDPSVADKEYFAKDVYLVFRSGNGSDFGPDWGAPIGVKSGPDADRMWMFRPGNENFWNAETPDAVRRNGVEVSSSGDFDMNADMGQYMILKVEAKEGVGTETVSNNTGNGSHDREYIVGTRTDQWGDARFDTAEVIVYDQALSGTDSQRVEAYLAAKYGIPGLDVNNGLNKSGNGTLTLVAANTFNGEVQVNGGRIVAADADAFGSDDAINFAQGASLGVQGDITLAVDLNFDGSSEIVNISGNNTLTGTIDATGLSADPQFTISSAAGILTIDDADDPLNIGDNQLVLDGAGDVVINSDIAATNNTTTFTRGMQHFGFHINNDSLALDLDNNGGMMGGGDPTTFQDFFGEALLTDGPGGRGLDFNEDTDFQDAGAIASSQNDNYSNLFLSTLHVSAADAGNWTFQRGADDDSMGIWLDLDQDGVFESTTAGLGSNRGEQLQWDNDNGGKTVNLAAGDYLFAVTHREGGSGSQLDVRVNSPTMASAAVIQPTHPDQAGYWNVPVNLVHGVVKNGTGTATIAGAGNYFGEVEINAGTLVAGSDTALGDTASGTTVEVGATLALDNTIIDTAGGGALDNSVNITLDENIVIKAGVSGGALQNFHGDNTVTGTVTMESAPPPIVRYALLDIGAGGQRVEPGALEVSSTSESLTSDTGDTFAVSISNQDTNGSGSGGIDFRDRGNGNANSLVALGEDHIKNNSGVIRVTLSDLPAGDYNATSYHTDQGFDQSNQIDVRVSIDGGSSFSGVLDSGDSSDVGNPTTAAVVEASAAQFSFTANGTDDVVIVFDGRPSGDNETPLSGLLLEVENPSVGSNPAGTVTLGSDQDNLTIEGVISGAPDLDKVGVGSVTLAAPNTYDGGTTVSSGTLLVNNTSGSGLGTGDATVESGATLGGTGSFTGSLTGESGGTVDPGVTTGDLASGVVTFNAGSIFAVDITDAPNADQLSVDGAVNLSGALSVSVDAGYTPDHSNVFVIIDNAGTITGTFDGIPNEGFVDGGGATFQVLYDSDATGVQGLGNDVVLVDVTPEVEFSRATFGDNEGAGTSVAITLTRTGSLDFATTVEVRFADGAVNAATGGTALPADYDNTTTPVSVTFNAGETTATAALTIFDDIITDVDETIDLTVTGSSNAIIGTQNTATFTIEDNDNRPPVVDAGGPYTIDAGSDLALDASATTDPDGDTLTYKWDFDQDGTTDFTTADAVDTAEWQAHLQNLSGGGTLGVGSHNVNLTVNDGSVEVTTTVVLDISATADVTLPPADSTADSFTVRLNGAQDTLEVVDGGGTVVRTIPRAGVTSFTFNGTSDEDTFTVDFDNGDPGIPIFINGNDPTTNPGDGLVIDNPNFTTITHDHTAADSGLISFSGTATTITYTGLEPVLINNGTVQDYIFNLPAGADNAQLSDIGGGNLRLESLDGPPTFEQTDFAVPSGSITINGGTGDTVTISTALNLGADLMIVADTINLGTSIQADSLTFNGDVRLSADTTLDTSSSNGDITIGGTVAATFADVDFVVDAGVNGNVLIEDHVGRDHFIEAGGVVVGEAEHYTRRTPVDPVTNNWLVVGDENVGAGTFTGARGDGRYIQNLLDDGSAAGPLVAPTIEYDIVITTAGTYDLAIRSASNGGAADSGFVDIVQIKGPGVADWYEFADDTTTFRWDAGGEAEANEPGPSNNPMRWDLTSGIYTLRFSQREDGKAIDSWVLSTGALPAGTGDGPAESTRGPRLESFQVINANNVDVAGEIDAINVIQNEVQGVTTVGRIVAEDLTVEDGDVTVAYGLEVGDSATIAVEGNASVTVSDGAVNIGDGTGDLLIGNRINNVNSANVTGALDVSGATSFSANVDNLVLGNLVSNGGSGNVTGTLTLGADNTINASIIQLGYLDGGNVQPVTGNLNLGAANTVNADTFIVGSHKGTGNVSFSSGGTLDLSGLTGSTTDLRIGDNSDSSTSSTATGTMDLSGGTLIADLGTLTIGDYASDTAGTGDGSGSAIGTLTLGTSASNDVDVDSVLLGNYARGGSGGSGTTKTASGTINMSGGSFDVASGLVEGVNTGAAIGAQTVSSVNVLGGTMTVANDLDVDNLKVGENSLNGTLTVTSGDVSVGDGTGTDLLIGIRDLGAGDGGTVSTVSPTTGTVDFSAADSVTIDVGNALLGDLDDGADNDNGSVTGTLTLSAAGLNTVTADLARVGYGVTQSNNSTTSSIALGGVANDLNIDDLVIGGTKSKGEITIVSGGTFDLTDKTGGSTGRLAVGLRDTATSFDATGELNLQGADLVTISVDDFHVGYISDSGTSTGNAQGIVVLSDTANTITATEIVIGFTEDEDNLVTSAMTLGTGTNIFNTDTWVVGDRESQGAVIGQTGGSLELHGQGGVGTRADLVVGRNASSSVFGTADQNSTGSFDVSGLTTFTAELDEFNIGQRTLLNGQNGNGTALGTVTLAATNTIDARTVMVSESDMFINQPQSTLALGVTNNIKADTFTVAGFRGNGLVEFATTGSTLNLTGSTGAETDLIIGDSTVGGTGNPTVGQMDLTGGTFNATLDNLILGDKIHRDTQSPNATGILGFESGTVTANQAIIGRGDNDGTGDGRGLGTFSVGGDATFEVGEIQLAVGTSVGSEGTVNQDGTATVDLTGGDIIGGIGTPLYNFTDGTLKDVNSINFDFQQDGGNLQIGADGDVDTMTVDGNYTSTTGATLEIDVNGAAGTADQLIVNDTAADSAVNIDGSMLSLNFLSAPAAPGTYILVDNDETGDATVGQFVNHPRGVTGNAEVSETFTIDIGGADHVFQINYAGGDGNDVVLEAFGEAETSVEINSGVLTITDINNTSDDDIQIDQDATHWIISDSNLVLTTSLTNPTAERVDANTIRVSKTGITGLVIDTLGDSGAGDEVTIASAVTVAGNVTVNAETINLNASINAGGSGDITFNGDVTQGSANVTLTGSTITFNGNTTLEQNDSSNTFGLSAGTGVVNSAGNNFDVNGGRLQLLNGTTFTNQGTMETNVGLDGESAIFANSSSINSKIVNEGTFTHNGSELRLYVTIENSSTGEVIFNNPSGAVGTNLQPSGSNGSGGAIVNDGTITISDESTSFFLDGSITNRNGGVVNVSGASLSFDNDTSLVNESGGTVNFDGDDVFVRTNASITNQSGGTMNLDGSDLTIDSGTASVTNGGEFNLEGGALSIDLDDASATFTNNGTFNWVNGADGDKQITGTGTFLNGSAGVFNHSHAGGADNLGLTGSVNLQNDGTFDLKSGGDIEFLGGDATFTNAGLLQKTGAASGDPSFLFDRIGTLDNGKFVQESTGSIQVAAGRLRIAVADGASDAGGTWTANGGDIELGGSWRGAITGSASGTSGILIKDSGNAAVPSGLIVGAGGLIVDVDGNGVTWESESISTSAGDLTNANTMTIEGGTLVGGGQLITSGGATTTITSGSSLTLNGSGMTVASDTATVTNEGNINLTGGALSFVINGANGKFTNDGTVTWVAGSDGNKSISGLGTFENNGTFNHAYGGSNDNLVLNNSVNFRNNGTFDFQQRGDIQFNGTNATFTNAGLLEKTVAGSDPSYMFDFDVPNQGVFVQTATGTVQADAGRLRIAANTNSSDPAGTWTAAGGDIELASEWTGTITGTASGTSGILITYSGNGGVPSNFAAGTGGVTFDVDGNGVTWESQTIDTTNGNVTNADTMTIAGTTGLAKVLTGGGELITANGATTTVTGTASSTGGSLIRVNDGGVLDGNGTFDGSVIAEDGADVAPGLAPSDIADFGTGDLTLEAGSTYTADLSGAASDTIVARGDVVIAGDLDIVFGSTAITPGTVFTLIENTTGNPTTGQFNGLAEGNIISLESGGVPTTLLRISYQGGDGNDVTLTASDQTATTDIKLVGTTLTLEDIDGNDTKDNLSVRVEGGALVITDLDGHTLGTLINGAVQTEFNEIRFTPGTGAGEVDFTNIVINTGNNTDSITIGDLGAGVLPGSITVNGGDDFDTISYTGNGSVLVAGANASFTAETIAFRDSDLTTSDGTISVTGTGGIAEGGDNFKGIELRNSSLSSGSGLISLTGEGGDTGNHNYGVYVFAGSSITTTAGGSIDIDGTGGGEVHGIGVRMDVNASVSTTGSGTLAIEGTGGGTINGDGILLSSGVSLSVAEGNMILNGVGSGSGGSSQGVSTVKSSLSSTGIGNIEITGTSSGSGRSNGGVDLVSTDIDALTGGGTGSVTLAGTGSVNGTRAGFGVQLLDVDVTTAATATLDITGTGNGTGIGNSGVILSGNTNLTGGIITLDGTGSVTGTSSDDGVVLAKRTDIVAAGALTITGTSGTGSSSQGVSASKANVSGGSIEITGVSLATGGRSNQGISLGNTTLNSGGTLDLTGTGGVGSRSNHGVYIAGGSLSASGLLTLLGTADGNTTGSGNAGVYMMRVNIGGLTGGSDITGSGGGSTSGLGNNNHGIFMHKLIGSITGSTTFDGTAGFGDQSEEEEGNFFPLI